jgi:hypothetical protein
LIKVMPKRSWKPTRIQIRASEAARAQADREAARIPWPKLLKARRDYIHWQAYALWVRAIEETEGKSPPWLQETVEKRARGYLRYAAAYSLHHKYPPRPDTAWRLLELWVSEHIFRRQCIEGWMNAVGYYAVKDLASLRDDAYSEWCIRNWKKHKPRSYPTFAVWHKASQLVPDEVLDQLEMRDDRRELIKRMTGIGPRALRSAVEKYVDWQVFALWARTAIEEFRQLPPVVERPLQARCPGFLEQFAPGRHGFAFETLMQWIEPRHFGKAEHEGWSDVLTYEADLHPRLQRAKDYWIDWEHEWTRRGRRSYPSFSAWSRALDCYTFEPEDSGSRPQTFTWFE